MGNLAFGMVFHTGTGAVSAIAGFRFSCGYVYPEHNDAQLLSSYTTEISAVIRYTNMFFFAIVIVYMCVSEKFGKEAKEQIDRIKADEKRFLAGAISGKNI